MKNVLVIILSGLLIGLAGVLGAGLAWVWVSNGVFEGGSLVESLAPSPDGARVSPVGNDRVQPGDASVAPMQPMVPSFVPSPEKKLSSSVSNSVPFTAQAPQAQWSNPIYQDGCEEASVIMSMRWAKGDPTLYAEEAKEEIQELADYQKEKFGFWLDASAADTARLIRDYYDHESAAVLYDVGANDIKRELAEGKLVLAPMNGRALGNPNFKPPGPERHMLVITGYDAEKDEFITNDPGTRKGAGYRYEADVLVEAMRDYPSGNHVPITQERRAMIVVGK